MKPIDRYYRNLDLGLALLRIIIGIVFIAHGGQKFFIYGYSNVGESFGQMGIPLPIVSAFLVSMTEFVGGILLILGLLTRIIAILLAITMLGAIVFVHAPNGFFAPKGIEYVLTLFGGSIALFFTGPGLYSLDFFLKYRAQKEELERL